jgi:antitoxin (DNA-binding transcriptional repressor) of toxin-antitoxin stability system
MKTATVRELRNHFPRVAAWIERGESVEITRSGKVIARLVPATRQTPREFKMPDIAARLQQTFGDSCHDSTDMARGLELSREDEFLSPAARHNQLADEL